MGKKVLLVEEKRAALIAALAEVGVVIVTPEELKTLSKEELEKVFLSSQEKTIEAFAIISDQTEQIVNDLKSELDSKETQIELKKPVIKIGTKKYQLNTPKFRHNNVIVDQKELESNVELAKEILEIEGQNILEELN